LLKHTLFESETSASLSIFLSCYIDRMSSSNYVNAILKLSDCAI